MISVEIETSGSVQIKYSIFSVHPQENIHDAIRRHSDIHPIGAGIVALVPMRWSIQISLQTQIDYGFGGNLGNCFRIGIEFFPGDFEFRKLGAAAVFLGRGNLIEQKYSFQGRKHRNFFMAGGILRKN
jgi:hypothetical protein